MSETVQYYNKERKERKKETQKDLVAITVRLPLKMVRMIDTICEIDNQSRAGWLRYIISSAIRRWKPPSENKHAWGPCRHCGARHDPALHGLEE